MRRLAVALCLAVAALAGPLAASGAMEGGMTVRVMIEFGAFVPEHVDVIAGDTVQWTNDSARAHTVNADDNSYDSPRMLGGDVFSRRFDGPGTYPYHCRLHPFMRGTVAAHMLLLDTPRAPAGPGRPFPISGRAALPSGSKVAIEADSGSGFQQVTTISVEPDGHFRAVVTPKTTARYRAVAGEHISPTIQLVVLDRSVLVSPAMRRSGFTVLTTVTPASPGAPVVLQLRLRDRFGWWPVARARLGRDSRVRLFVRLRRRVPARVLLTLPDGATALAVSRTFRLGPQPRARR